MIQKIFNPRFSMPAQNLITSYLSNRTQRTLINNVKSGWIQTAQGVSQRTVLGPLLFNIFVNDLSKFLSCETIQYTEDTVLSSFHDEVLKCNDELEKAIETCIHFLKLHHLKFSPDKTEFMIFVALILKTKRHIKSWRPINKFESRSQISRCLYWQRPQISKTGKNSFVKNGPGHKMHICSQEHNSHGM